MAVDKYGFVEVGGLSRIGNASSISNPQGDLLLSSSGVVGLSSSILFNNLNKTYHISGPAGSTLIFSSSNVSTSPGVMVSGNLTIISQTAAQGRNSFRVLKNDGTTAMLNVDDGTGTPITLLNTVINGNLGVNGASGIISFDNASGGKIYNSAGQLILSSGLDSIVAFSASQQFVNTDKNYHIRAVNSHLILSSTVGSVIALSSSEDYVNIDKSYHIRAVNSDLILSSSSTSAVALSSSMVFLNSDKNYHIKSANSSLILSSSVGSNVVMSASQDFVNTDKNYHINSVNSDLILSSTAGSVVSVSASMVLNQPSRYSLAAALGQCLILSSTQAANAARGVVVSGNLTVIAHQGAAGGYALRVMKNDGSTAMLAIDDGTSVPIAFNSKAAFNTETLIQGAANSGFSFYNNTKLTHYGSSHVLSSSVTSLLINSGNLYNTGYASASLPSPIGNTNIPSGTVSWVTDIGGGIACIAINGAWHRIQTASF